MPFLPDEMTPTGYLPTPGGSIPYAVMWNAKESYYGESAGEKTPTTITVKIRVNWEDSTLFTEFARGYACYSGAGVRKRLRDLVQFLDKAQRRPVYTDFEDRVGPETAIDLPGFGAVAGDFEKFRLKARAFLRQHAERGALKKLRSNERLAAADLAELEGLLSQCGGSAEQIARARGEANGLGLFVRSLVGLDREAAKRAFGGFLAGSALTANQIEFVNQIVDHLTEHGVMSATLLYETPFTDLESRGPDGLFSAPQIRDLLTILGEVQSAATAA